VYLIEKYREGEGEKERERESARGERRGKNRKGLTKNVDI
jgi:hypothetical protein